MTEGTSTARRLGLVLRIAVSSLLVWWILGRVDLGRALELLAAVRPLLVVAALVSLAGTHALNCWRWRWCLLEERGRMPWRSIVVSYWTALFAGLALPTEFGGDVLRVKDAWDRLGDGSAATTSVAWSRFAGVAATLATFGLAGLAQPGRLRELSLGWVWGLATAVCVALAAVAADGRVASAVLSPLEGLVTGPGRLRRGLARGLEQARLLATRRGYGGRIAALALGPQVLMIVSNLLYAHALGLPVGFLDMALVLPLVTLSSLLPVGLGGIGVKEGAFVLGLTAVGMSQEGALSVALLNRLGLLALSLSGGLLFPFRRRLLRRP